jgi:DNA-binding MarR family transcriptional regulator
MAASRKSSHLKLPVIHTGDEARLNTWLQLIRTVALIEREVVSTLSEHDLTLSQFDVLATLRFREGVTQQELAASLLVTKGNVCGLLNRLEESGWVERRPDSVDSRINRLHLTSAGRKKIEVTTPAHNKRILEMLSPLTSSEVTLIHSLMTKLEKTLTSPQN